MVPKLKGLPRFQMKNMTQELFEGYFRHQVVPGVKI